MYDVPLVPMVLFLRSVIRFMLTFVDNGISMSFWEREYSLLCCPNPIQHF